MKAVKKITSEADIDQLALTIKKDLGVDIEKYRNQEVVDNLTDLLVIPEYIVTWAIRPILFSLALYVLGFYVIPMEAVGITAYAIIGFFLFLINGFFSALLFLMWKAKKDFVGILNYALDLLKSATEDMSLMNASISAQDRKAAIGMLFKGVVFVVLLPTITESLSNKIPLIGFVFKALIRKILMLIASKIDFDAKVDDAVFEKGGDPEQLLEAYSTGIEKERNLIDNTLTIVFSIAQLPLKLMFGISFCLLSLFVYILW